MDTKIYKEKLEAELKTLEQELQSVGIKDPNNPQDWIAVQPEENISPADENEVADTIDDFENNRAILNDLEIRYNDVKLALEKIEKGTYGMCEINNHPIDEDRLMANPSARTCKEHME
ncbi:MAG: TraR/DksA C4-type zinc finger protein [Candidatus Pacebacteria bacterium]|nr:TraR/DksA C4-type zinc finger protein [Candidatus Paceibacterota bacterium]